MGVREDVIRRELSKPGYKSKINAKCCDCVYDDTQPGTWRQQTEGCLVTDCPLYDARPKSLAVKS